MSSPMFDTGDESRKAKHGIINSSGLPQDAGSYTEPVLLTVEQ